MLNFLGIGAQKAGTSWLYEMLCLHPEISFPRGKEIHFWVLFRERGIHWYEQGFAEGEKIEGEIPPAYSILDLKQIQEIHSYYSAIKLIYLLRNPSERAWSAALMALERTEMTIEEASDQWFLDHFHSQGSLKRGDYETCLRNWLSFYPREQLLILRYEQLSHSPRLLLEQTCAHLGVSPLIYQKVPAEDLQRKVFAGAGYSLRPQLRAALQKIYQPKIQSLAVYLGEDFSAWLE